MAGVLAKNPGHRIDEDRVFCDEPLERAFGSLIHRAVGFVGDEQSRKHRDGTEVPNFLHVMLASNHDWVVPAGAFERRYVVARVAETYRQDLKYFATIYQQLKDGGHAAMLYDLLHHDLSNWHPREIVRTPELARQQEESLAPLDAWWFELLQTGVLPGRTDKRNPDAAVSNHWEERVIDVDDWGNKRPRFVKREGLYDQARRCSPKLKGESEHKLGDYLKKKGCTKARPWRRRGWKFLPLSDCRTAWEAHFPSIVWHDPNLKDWTCEEDG